MRDFKGLKKIAIAYAVFMALGVFLIIYLPSMCLPFFYDEETAKSAEETVINKETEIQLANNITGDVYDTYGNTIVSVVEDVPNYRDNYAYSNTIGYSYKGMNSLLLGNVESVLKAADGGGSKGNSITLTLDSELQEYCYKLAVGGDGDRSGIVVLDAEDGAILAMSNTPSYDIDEVIKKGNNIAYDSEVAGYITNPLANPVRPGSIFKIITGIEILEHGKGNKGVEDDGVHKFPDGGIIKNYNADEDNPAASYYGTRFFIDAFVDSSNVYFGKMAYELGWNSMDEVTSRFKIGDQNIPFEFGIMNSTYESTLEPYDKSESNTRLAKVGFGYEGCQLTALHAAMITQSIANGGYMSTPYMIKSVNETYEISTGNDVYEYEKGEEIQPKIDFSHKGQAPEKLISPDVRDKLEEAMIATYKDGYSLASDTTVDGMLINGETITLAIKTGTAELDDEGTKNAIWMVSYAPIENPKYVVVEYRYGVEDQRYGISLLGDVVSVYNQLFSE